MSIYSKEVFNVSAYPTSLEKKTDNTDKINSEKLKIDFKIYLSEFKSFNLRQKLLNAVEHRLCKIEINAKINPRISSISGIEKGANISTISVSIPDSSAFSTG